VNDLIAALRAAIDATERAIDAYERHRAGDTPCINHADQDPGDYSPHDTCHRHIVTFRAAPYSDMEFGRRRCVADRKLLDAYVEIADNPQRLHDPALHLQWNVLRSVIYTVAEGYSLNVEEYR
jgi:hypothetical protein